MPPPEYKEEKSNREARQDLDDVTVFTRQSLEEKLGKVHFELFRDVHLRWNGAGGGGFYPVQGLTHEQLSYHDRAKPIEVSQLRIDLAGDTQRALLVICSAADRHLMDRLSYTRQKRPSPSRIFLTQTDHAITSYIEHLATATDLVRHKDSGTQFLTRAAQILQVTFAHPERMRQSLLFRLWTKDEKDHVNRYGIFAALFPEIERQILQIPIDQEHLTRLTKEAPLLLAASKMALQRVATARRPVRVQDILLTSLRFQEQGRIQGRPMNDLSVLLHEGRTLVNSLNPNNPRASTPKVTVDQQKLNDELALFGVSPRGHTQSSTVDIQNPPLEQQVGKEPDLQQVETLLKNPELLVDPHTFDLQVDPILTQLVRSVHNRYLDPPEKKQRNSNERQANRERILFVGPETIRRHPKEYHRYQMALARAIAEKLNIPLDKKILVPIPAWVKPEHEGIFRQQEATIKSLPGDEYLLLYESVQRVFLEFLPFCAVPPYCIYRPLESNGLPSSTESIIRFAWDKPPTKKHTQYQRDDHINHLPMLNFFDPRDFRQHKIIRHTIPGEFLYEIISRYGCNALIIHGLARKFFGRTGMRNVSQDEYMADEIAQAILIPKRDVDIVVFGDRANLGDIAKKTANKHSAYGVIGGFRETLIMRTIAGWISKVQREKIPGLLNEAQHPATFCQAMRAWMGRAVNQPTDFMILGLMPLARFRSFGILPVPIHAHGRDVFFARAVDLFGGLEPFVNGDPAGGGQRMPITFIDHKAAFPDDHPMAYWQLVRTAADVAWQKGTLEWDSIRPVVKRLYAQWPKVKAKLNEVQIKDLHTDARKAMIKALHDDALTIWTLLGGSAIRSHGVEGIDLSVFYPSIHALRLQHLTQVTSQTAYDYIFDRLGEEVKSDNEDGLAVVVRIVLNSPEVTAIIKRQVRGKSLTPDVIRDWLTQPLFGQKIT